MADRPTEPCGNTEPHPRHRFMRNAKVSDCPGATPRLDVLIDRACRHLTPDEGRALRAGMQELALAQFELTNQRETFNIAWEQQAADLERARGERGTYRDAWHSARDRARKRSEERDRARRWAVHLENENRRLEDEQEALTKATAKLINDIGYARTTLSRDVLGWAGAREDMDLPQTVSYAVAEHRSELARAERAEQQAANVRATLAEVLAEFVHDTHPGERCKQTGHIRVADVDRWRAALDAAGQDDTEQAREVGHTAACGTTEATDAPGADDDESGRHAPAQDLDQWAAIIAAEVDPHEAADRLRAHINREQYDRP